MIVDKNVCLRPEAVGVSSFYPKERLLSSKLRWTLSCLPVCMKVLNVNGIKTSRFQVELRQKGVREKKLLCRLPELMDRVNLMIEEDMQRLNHSSKYETAMETLSSLITRKKRGDKSRVGGKYKKLERMRMYIKILGLEEHVRDLKIIHVAGTKGKGSTCTFCEAILRECGFRTGLFTSPHLIDVRERFRLDGSDISEEKFLHYFWECWHQLKKNVTDDLPMPPLFQFLTVLAFKIFACEKVDVSIIEVGLGGTKDSTNVIKSPVVCGISPLGMDHMEALGATLGEIASHKAGIFKPRIPAFTVPQLPEAMDVLQEKANELKVPLKVVAPLDRKKLNRIQLSLSGDHQLTNAGLAVALCKSWLKSTRNWEKLFKHDDSDDNIPEPFLRGLSTARLSGRAQIVYDSSYTTGVIGRPAGDLIFYLDGAHSPESMEACARWFSSAAKDGQNQSSSWCNGYVQPRINGSDRISKKILLFNCMDVRDPEILLTTLVDECASSGIYFSKAIFVPSISTYSKVTSGSSAIPLDIPPMDFTWQFNLQKVWETIIYGKDACKTSETKIPRSTPPDRFIHENVSVYSSSDGLFCCSSVVSSLPSTIRWLRDYIKRNPSFRIQVLVTGSLHLVGDVLKLLQMES